MDPGSSTGWVFVVFGAGIFIYALFLRKGLAHLRDDVDRAWSQLDAALKQWTETIEKLRGLNNTAARGELADALAQWTQSESMSQKASSFARLQNTVNSFVGAVNGNPDVTASESVLQLKSQLADLQQNVQSRRKLYNQRVSEYNSTIGQIPDVFVASYMGLQRRELFIVPANQKDADARN